MLFQIQILTNEIYCYLFFSVLNAKNVEIFLFELNNFVISCFRSIHFKNNF